MFGILFAKIQSPIVGQKRVPLYCELRPKKCEGRICPAYYSKFLANLDISWLKTSNVCPFLLLALKIKINHEPFSLNVVIVAAVIDSCCFSTLGALDWF